MNNAFVTRYVTEGVTVPRPDPTRPTVLTVVFHLLGTARFRSNGYLGARSFGIGHGQ